MSTGHAEHSVEKHASSISIVLTFVGVVVFMALMIAVGMMRTEGSSLYDPGMSLQTQLFGEALLGAGAGVLVLFFFMNLKMETRFMKLFLLLPLVFTAIYSLALISEAIWRRKW
jgi:hypothetical protein